jgi:hypothetical protein
MSPRTAEWATSECRFLAVPGTTAEAVYRLANAGSARDAVGSATTRAGYSTAKLGMGPLGPIGCRSPSEPQ